MDAEKAEASNEKNTIFIDDYFHKYVSPMLALRELYELLEINHPDWYTREIRNLVRAALKQWHWAES